VRELGLKFGLHIMRGIPRRAAELDLPVFGTQWTAREIADPENVCPWNPDNLGLNHDHPGAQAYYDAQVAQFAAWGVDFVKADDMLAPYHDREIAAYARAIERSGRDIVLSLSPGTQLSTHHLDHLRANAQLWRVSDDLWDRWEDVHAQFARMARWAPFQQPGGWADADMLPLGHIGIRAERGDDRTSRLTADEQRTLLTLWVMARSPLMMGGDLPTTDDETLALLANPALSEVLRKSYDGREIIREPVDDGGLIVWTARADDATFAAIFWTGTSMRKVSIPLKSLAAQGSARDLWDGTAHPVTEQLECEVPPHGVRWFRLT
jgi:hypothetical protein